MATHLPRSAPDACLDTPADRLDLVPSPDNFAACPLGARTDCVVEARRFTAFTLARWSVAPTATEDAETVVSELVSNALRHGGPVAGRCDDAGYAAWLGLLRQEAAVLCVVTDHGSGEPRLRPADHFAESGRGLHIVDTLSQEWGWTSPDGSGKTVWATIAAQC